LKANSITLGVVSDFCVLQIVGSSCLKMSATKQYDNLKFCILLQKLPSETLQMLEEVYDKAAVRKTQVYEWHKCFPDGRMNVNDNPPCRDRRV
jgi:hypothetical protein